MSLCWPCKYKTKKKCETENIPAITPYKTDKSNQLNVINSDIFFTANVPRQQETRLNQNDWEIFINEAHETKSSKDFWKNSLFTYQELLYSKK